MSNLKDSPIGIFDSGVGGLSVVHAIQQLLPSEKLIYVADSLHTPYGNKSDQFILDRSLKISDFLISKDVKAVVVACNTATAASIQHLRNQYSIPFIGLEPALKPAVENSQRKSVGVLATKSTLESEKYQRLKKSIAQDCQVIEASSLLFVELVESAKEIDDSIYCQIERELKPFKDARVDALVLGCTHYPFLTDSIKQIMGKQVTLFESALPVAVELQRNIEKIKNTSLIKNKISYYSSQPETAKTIFESLLDKRIVLNNFE